jgi:hypothetical protein
MKMIADMICGPANMVMARGSICRFITLAPLVLPFLQRLPWVEAYGEARCCYPIASLRRSPEEM